MRLTHDTEHDLSYLHLRGSDDDVGTVTSVPVTPPNPGDLTDELVLDFDRDGRLVGIEFLRATRRLQPSVLADADRRA